MNKLLDWIPYIVVVLSGLGLLGNASIARALDPDRKMDDAMARAMLNRFGYGATPSSLGVAMNESPHAYLVRSIRAASNLPPAIQEEIRTLPISEPVDAIWERLGPGGTERSEQLAPDAKMQLQKIERQYAGATVQARLLAIANSDNQGHEALLSFWLNHFSIYAPKNFDKLLSWDYARTIERAMADDSFESLLRASFYHPAMQIYLDNAQSTAPSSTAARWAATRGKTLGINENLARELLELHTLGVNAGYSQKDVQELARIITGAGVYSPRMHDRALDQAGATRMGIFLFDPRRHDFGEKTFLGVRFPAGHGMDEIDRALHLLATSPATAHRIALKLATRFLSDDPPESLVDAMAAGYLRTGGRISATLMPLIESRAFADSLAAPAKFKEPLDYLVSAARATCGDTPVGNGFLLMAAAQDMGEAPFMHTTPDGYPMRESDWLSPAAMAKRTRLAMGIAANRIPFANGPETDTQQTRLHAMMGEPKPKWMRGTMCQPDLVTVAKMTGTLSTSTSSAQQGLTDAERIGLLLASPEFMRR